jgi:hypothetical protein
LIAGEFTLQELEMPDAATQKIDINLAGVRILTQLPGVSKTVAYRIVNHRQRHGYLTNWEELREIKEFPVEKLDAIKARATLTCPDIECNPPRRVKASQIAEVKKKPAGFTKRARATQGSKRYHDTSSRRPH